ncbi:MAG: GTP 3',8-cyclase MoaA [Clostridiales bacterium]|nr:GTP 3',8-cyclase MoaA [Clostridiales bacterium]
MIDGKGREIDYIRISVTDRCNLRCCYCMPEDGIPACSHEEILRYDEILRLTEAFAGLGFRKVKLTGGEPLVRRNLAGLVGELKAIPGIEQVTLTTNGVLLQEQMKELAEAGIDSINLSLDSLDPGTYQQITRRDCLDQVLEGMREALRYPGIPLKINCVPMGQSEEELCELAELARTCLVHVRFIEMMPIGLGKGFQGRSEQEILEILEDRFGPAGPVSEILGNGPGHYYEFAGFHGRIGFISAVSHKFCHTCNRVRLTSQGYLKTCLQYDRGKDMREPLRAGASLEELQELIREALLEKPEGHAFFQNSGENKEQRIMSQIGG